RGRDVEAGGALAAPARRDHDVPEGTVVDVEDPRPRHAPGREARGATEVDVVVDERGQQVVRRGDRVQVAREVQVDVVGRLHLRPAAARAPALDPEHGTQRRLPQADGGPHAQAPQTVGQADA